VPVGLAILDTEYILPDREGDTGEVTLLYMPFVPLPQPQHTMQYGDEDWNVSRGIEPHLAP